MMTRIAVAAFLVCFLSNEGAPQLPARSVQDQCAELSASQLEEYSRLAPRTVIKGAPSIWPGNEVVTITVPHAPTVPSAFCLGLASGTSVRVISALPGTGADAGTTTLTLALPKVGFGWAKSEEVMLAAFPLDAGGQLLLGAPSVAAVQRARFSNGEFALLIAVLLVLIVYFFASLALATASGGSGLKTRDVLKAANPVALSAGTYGRASLSQLQIFGFTLLVVGLLTYVLLRLGLLSDISEDVLLLLGISAAGSAGAKVAGINKRRLSSESWSWLRSQGWLKTDLVAPGGDNTARWGDLLRTDGRFDVYSFQLATVSLIVGGALLLSARDLATFTIPGNLLALLGLSNVVYIGGKAVAPDSVNELDKQIESVRKAEADWRKAAAANIGAVAGQPAKLQAALAAAPALHQAYLTVARPAAATLVSLYPAGTKFDNMQSIPDDDLAPVF